MVTSDVLGLARERLKDKKIPYLWPDWELLIYANMALTEWVKQTGCIRDESTPAICTIPILANQHSYAMSSKITEIHYGRLSVAASDVKVKNDIWVSQWVRDWKAATGKVEYLIPDYDFGKFRVVRYPGTDTGYFTGAFTFTATAPSKTIAQTRATFSTYLKADDQIVISGTTLNGTNAIPATFTVATVAADSFTVDEAIADEAAAAGIIQKITDTLSLTVTRLPADLLATTMNTQIPEMRSEDLPYLVDGIMREAFLKKDSDTLDPKASASHGEIFEHNKLRARWQKDNLRYSETIARPGLGNL